MLLAAFVGQQRTKLCQSALPALAKAMILSAPWVGWDNLEGTREPSPCACVSCRLCWEQEWNLDGAGRSRIAIPPGRIWL